VEDRHGVVEAIGRVQHHKQARENYNSQGEYRSKPRGFESLGYDQ